jgi:hypothetical protein
VLASTARACGAHVLAGALGRRRGRLGAGGRRLALRFLNGARRHYDLVTRCVTEEKRGEGGGGRGVPQAEQNGKARPTNAQKRTGHGTMTRDRDVRDKSYITTTLDTTMTLDSGFPSHSPFRCQRNNYTEILILYRFIPSKNSRWSCCVVEVLESEYSVFGAVFTPRPNRAALSNALYIKTGTNSKIIFSHTDILVC